MMTRPPLLVLVAAGLLGVLAVTTTPSSHQAVAQGREARVFGERACLDYGVAMGTLAFESCVGRAARAFERGEPDIAYMQARATRDALDDCASQGLSPQTPDHRQCVINQIGKRTEPSTLMREIAASP
jgi:hypothetical protein